MVRDLGRGGRKRPYITSDLEQIRPDSAASATRGPSLEPFGVEVRHTGLIFRPYPSPQEPPMNKIANVAADVDIAGPDPRRISVPVIVGGVKVGGGAPIVVQSMT